MRTRYLLALRWTTDLLFSLFCRLRLLATSGYPTPVPKHELGVAYGSFSATQRVPGDLPCPPKSSVTLKGKSMWFICSWAQPNALALTMSTAFYFWMSLAGMLKLRCDAVRSGASITDMSHSSWESILRCRWTSSLASATPSVCCIIIFLVCRLSATALHRLLYWSPSRGKAYRYFESQGSCNLRLTLTKQSPPWESFKWSWIMIWVMAYIARRRVFLKRWCCLEALDDSMHGCSLRLANA